MHRIFDRDVDRGASCKTYKTPFNSVVNGFYTKINTALRKKLERGWEMVRKKRRKLKEETTEGKRDAENN